MRPKYVITCSGGGSGFENCFLASKDGRVEFDVAGMLYNIEDCGAKAHAIKYGIPHRYFPKHDRIPGAHEAAVRDFVGDEECFVMGSGCLWLMEMKDGPHDPGPGLDPRFTLNIHPAKLSIIGPDGHPLLGGKDMHGDAVHQEVLNQGLTSSGLAIHFMTKRYDEGPIIFEFNVPVIYDDWKHLKKGINPMEHYFQPWVMNEVAHKRIRWDGKNPDSLIVPDRYRFLPKTM